MRKLLRSTDIVPRKELSQPVRPLLAHQKGMIHIGPSYEISQYHVPQHSTTGDGGGRIYMICTSAIRYATIEMSRTTWRMTHNL